MNNVNTMTIDVTNATGIEAGIKLTKFKSDSELDAATVLNKLTLYLQV